MHATAARVCLTAGISTEEETVIATPDFHGVIPYLVSPVNEDGTVREGVLRRLVSHLIDKGVHGLSPLGSTGEIAYLTWEQRHDIARIVIDEAGDRVPVIPGVAAAGSADAIRQARAMEQLGAKGIVLVLLPYFPLTRDEVLSYYRDVAASISIPIVIYYNPRFQGFHLDAAMLEELIASADNIRCIKDASGNTGSLLSLRRRVGDRLLISAASAHIPLHVMQLGGVGWMSGPACVAPEASVRLYELARRRAWDEAMPLQEQLWELNEAFQKYNLAACIKAGLELQGFDVGPPLAPQRPLTEEQREELAGVLRRLGVA